MSGQVEPATAKRTRRGLWRPLALLAATALLHLAGGREAAVVLSGAAPPGLGTLVGLIYVMLWLFCVVVVPPWLASVLVSQLLPELWRRRHASAAGGSDEPGASSKP